jgi:hypothetical protein
MCSLVFPTQYHRLNTVNPSLAPTEHHTQAAENITHKKILIIEEGVNADK